MKILVVLDHPYTIDSAENVPHQRSFSAAVAAAAIRGARSAGHEVDLIDLAADQASPDLARLADLAVASPADAAAGPPGPWQLTTALRATSQGIYCDQAATELIIAHGAWLRRTDFTGQFIRAQSGPPGRTTAVIDWDEAITALHAGKLPCAASEAVILLLAASLATASLVNLRDAVTGLDQANLHLITGAIRHAGGRS